MVGKRISGNREEFSILAPLISNQADLRAFVSVVVSAWGIP